MIVFGRWSLWAVVAMATFVLGAALVSTGDLVFAAALVAVVVIGAIYSRRGS